LPRCFSPGTVSDPEPFFSWAGTCECVAKDAAAMNSKRKSAGRVNCDFFMVVFLVLDFCFLILFLVFVARAFRRGEFCSGCSGLSFRLGLLDGLYFKPSPLKR
jgi:hypothetical protein